MLVKTLVKTFVFTCYMIKVTYKTDNGVCNMHINR